MPTWNAEQYLKFADERTRPCRELAARVAIEAPARIINLGCGPGNSTAVLIERWPAAEVTGLDSSPEMIVAARRANPAGRWMQGDIAEWAAAAPSAGEPAPDIVFSNAALQWVPDHAALFPQLLARVAPAGALAVQVPTNRDAPAHREMRDLAASASWRDRFSAGGPRPWHVHEAPFYYDVLAPLASRVDFWETEYIQVMADAEAIVAWYRGSGLRPFLDALSTEADRERFTAEYLAQIRQAYPPRPDGRVLFPFGRFSMIAYRPE